MEKLKEFDAELPADRQEKMLQRAIELSGTRAAAVEALGITGDDTIKPSPSPQSSDDQ